MCEAEFLTEIQRLANGDMRRFSPPPLQVSRDIKVRLKSKLNNLQQALLESIYHNRLIPRTLE